MSPNGLLLPGSTFEEFCAAFWAVGGGVEAAEERARERVKRAGKGRER